MLCGTFGCTLPDSHAGLHQVPPPARARERRPTAKARDDSDSDEEQPAAELHVTAFRTQRTKARVPPVSVRPASGKSVIGTQRVQASALPARITRPDGGVCKRRIDRRCEHDRRRNQCKECGGSGFCEHGRRRSRCKECGGSGICEHDRLRSQCKECGGSGFCEHGRLRSMCKECGSSSFCEHGKQRSKCKECKECAVLAMGEDGLIDFLDVLSDFHVEIDV